MKRYFLLLALIFNLLYVSAQFTATGTYKIYTEINGVKLTGIDYLFVFDGISSETEIEYTLNSSSIKWSKFTSPTDFIVLQYDSINTNVEDATGYIVDIDGVKKYIWVIDYKNYLPQIATLIPEDKPTEQCDNLILNVKHSISALQYQTAQNVTKSIPRTFQLTYATKEWSESTKSWSDKVISSDYQFPTPNLFVTESPLCDTKFKLTGDNFAADLGLAPFEIESPLYNAVKVQCHVVSSASTRKELNENDRPEKEDVTTSSAPIEIIFTSNANTPITEFYEWQILKDNSLLFTRNDPDLRYTFNEAGTYTVKLSVTNTYNCVDSNSITIKVLESKIEVPRVFTPNGDGMNEEFRVVYKSIVQFRCWIFNRWQQKVFYWTDPQKGWDGKINGRPAAEGAYFYIVEAVGADGQKYSLKGNVNLLRGKKK